MERRCANQFETSDRTARRYIKTVRDRWAAEAATGTSRTQLRDETRRTLNAAVALEFDRSDPRATVSALRVLVDVDALAAKHAPDTIEVKVTQTAEKAARGMESLEACLRGRRDPHSTRAPRAL